MKHQDLCELDEFDLELFISSVCFDSEQNFENQQFLSLIIDNKKVKYVENDFSFLHLCYHNKKSNEFFL